MRKEYLSLLVGIFFVTSFYQNCSKRTLWLSEPPSEVAFSEVDLKTSICSEVSFLDNENNNFLFILDMSTSNIGDFRKEMMNFGGQEHPIHYWDPSLGTDIHGARFKAIENFITSCAKSSNNKFAVIGFAEEAGQIQYDPRNRPYLSCGDPISFKSKEEAINDLHRFQKAEQSEARYYSQWVNRFYDEEASHRSLALRWTSYSEAAECANKIIYKDLLGSFEEQIDSYQILFISDGRPRDSENVTHSCKDLTGKEQDECYVKTATAPFKKSIQDVGAIRRRVNILTVAYGLNDREDLKFLDAIASVQRSGGTKELDNFEENTDALCSLILSQFGVETHSDSLMLTVLSLRQRGGQYHSDSDMDGLLDDDESILGYDPTHPRSQVQGVLDGICEKIGGIAHCHRAMEQITCHANSLMRGGFSDCDIKILKHHWKELNLDDSSDWDKDGVPNFIEIVKGTEPVIDDMNNDPDNDSLSTRFEIMRSKNPFEHEKFSSPHLPQVLIRNESSEEAPQCSQKVRHLILERVPFVESQFVGTGMSTELLHRVDEHVVAIFSTRKSQNYLLLDKGTIGKFVKLSVVQKGHESVLVPSIHQLTNSDLEEWDQ